MTGSISVITPWFPNKPGDWPGSFVHDSCAAVVHRGWSADVIVARRTIPPFMRQAASNMDCGDVVASAFPPQLDVSVSRYPALPRDRFINIWQPLRDSLIKKAFASRHGRRLPKLIHVHTEGLLTAGLRDCLISLSPVIDCKSTTNARNARVSVEQNMNINRRKPLRWLRQADVATKNESPYYIWHPHDGDAL
jgi:hypothetical protein